MDKLKNNKPFFKRFPFAIAHTIKLKRAEYDVSSGALVLNHVEETLQELNMPFERLSDRELLLRKKDILKAFNHKTFLNNLLVTVDIDSTHISVRLQTETIFVFLLGLFPILAILTGHFQVLFGLTGFIFWCIGYLIRDIALLSVKHAVEYALKRL